MLDNLRIGFKSRYRTELKEKRREVQSVELLENITKSHFRLAKNGYNHFEIEGDPLLPKYILVATMSFSSVGHILIYNAFKHTYRGKVEVNFKKPTSDVRDDEKGIAAVKIKKIFVVMKTDQNAANLDGTGLGLSICE